MKEKDDSWMTFFKANPSFAFILLFLFAIALGTLPFHLQVCAEYEEYPCKYIIRESLLAGFFDYANRYSGAIVAFFTATLWVSAVWQGRLTRDSINLARQEFIATHRPSLRIRRITLREMTPNYPITATVEIANVGDSRVVSVAVISDIYVRAQGSNPTPQQIPIGDIPTGYTRTYVISSFTPCGKHLRIGIERGVHDLCVIGVISYWDENGTMRSTGFFRVYRMDSGRFAAPAAGDADSDREYED
jgi:hypothetical protein